MNPSTEYALPAVATASPFRELAAASPGTGGFSLPERDALLVLGHLHLEQARPAEAATLLRPLHRAQPDDREVECCLALAELLSGQPEAAARLAAHAYPHASDQARPAIGLIYAKALWLSGEEPAAREVLLKIIQPKSSAA